MKFLGRLLWNPVSATVYTVAAVVLIVAKHIWPALAFQPSVAAVSIFEGVMTLAISGILIIFMAILVAILIFLIYMIMSEIVFDVDWGEIIREAFQR